MHTKSFDTAVDSIGGENNTDLKDGQFKAIVSVFDNVDSFGDVIRKGAFAKSLQDWSAKGDEIPVIWSHDWADPFSHLGTVQKAVETDRGLEITGYISPEDRAENPKAAQVYRLLKSRRVTQFSFAFDIEDGGYETKDGKEFFELRQLKIHEVGPCLLGVNQETELLAAKATELTQRELTGPIAIAQLRKAYETIGKILDVTPNEEPLTDSPAPENTGAGETQQGEHDAANPTGGPASDPGAPATTIAALLELELELADSNDEEREV